MMTEPDHLQKRIAALEEENSRIREDNRGLSKLAEDLEEEVLQRSIALQRMLADLPPDKALHLHTILVQMGETIYNWLKWYADDARKAQELLKSPDMDNSHG